MSYQLKDFYSRSVVLEIAESLSRGHSSLDVESFTDEAVRDFPRQELTERGRAIARVMRKHLPDDFEQAAEVLIGSLGPELPLEGSAGMAPFRYLPHVFYVADHGLDSFEASMRAQYEITKRFSAEYSIRTFLERYEAETLARLHEWASDESAHVRRLVSEGTRPRLPWAPRLRRFQQDPTPVLALLERLKDDPALYVRRSVANNLNDIGKDHPAVLVEVCRRWSDGAGEERRWLIRHALRGAVKRGDKGALALLGFGKIGKIEVTRAEASPRRVKMGGRVTLTVELENRGRRRETLMVDLTVHFVKSNGQTRPKVFKLKHIELPPGGSETLAKSISLADLTTRTHYPGKHRFEVLVNGATLPGAEFVVTR